MPVRIHFTDDDLAHIRLAQTPDPLWEALLSMHVLQTNAASAVFGPWRRAVRPELPAPVRELLRLAPPHGYSPDFLTPAGGAGGLEAGIGALLSTPRGRLRHDLLELSRAGRKLPSWAPSLAEGDGDAVAHLAQALRTYIRIALAPWWNGIRTRLDAERSLHDRFLTTHHLGGLLSRLHPGLSWQPLVLEVSGLGGADRDVRLDGRGLLVLPSYFCWRRPTLLKDPTLPVVVVYPMAHDTAVGRTTRPRPSLGALLGQTRTEVLESLAEHHGMTTTELAHGVGIAPATASHHAGVLREAGLLSTSRAGQAVLHTLTPLGLALLDG
ncbi:ArsR/SmtB family transcription factor [Streptomyces sp. NPDC058469]|uniref:ArsR/SmtB family transcription factor n=1 Tax=Streptomyces sp. NPDC058469 TaxID=3346514 RepID=UPI00365663E2